MSAPYAVGGAPAAVTLVTGQSRPVEQIYGDGYRCPWCGAGVLSGAECGNPACVAYPGTSEAAVRAVLDRWAQVREEERERERRAEFSRQYAEQSRRARQERLAEVTEQARQRGACMQCLARSPWEHRPRYVVHRTPNHHERNGS